MYIGTYAARTVDFLFTHRSVEFHIFSQIHTRAYVNARLDLWRNVIERLSNQESAATFVRRLSMSWWASETDHSRDEEFNRIIDVLSGQLGKRYADNGTK